MGNDRGIYQHPPGTYWIRWTDLNHKTHREKIGPKLTDARALLAKRKYEKMIGRKFPERIREHKATISDLACLLDPDYGYKNYKLVKVLAAFGSRVADDVRPEDISRWLDAQGYKQATKNRYVAIFKKLYRVGEENRKITYNPARSLHMRKENNQRVRWLNQHQPVDVEVKSLVARYPNQDVNDLIQYAESVNDLASEEERLNHVIAVHFPFHKNEFIIALNTGMRKSEQFNLTWDRVNFERRLVTIARSKHGDTRHVHLNSVALRAFTELQERSAPRSNYVFTRERVPGRLTRVAHWFPRACREAGVHDFHWHDLRHTFASRLIMAGVDLRTVQELMGHKTIAMTCRYAHLSAQHQQNAVEKLVSA